MKDTEKIKEMHEAKVSQTETALVEVCKSLGLQQQQLEQQELCTGMIHQLLQDCLPNLHNLAKKSEVGSDEKSSGGGVCSKADIEATCKEACGKLEQALREEHQSRLAELISTFGKELEIVRGEAVSVAMNCCREMQQNQDERVDSEARAVVGAELEAQISEVRGDLDSLRTELLGALRQSISDDVGRQLGAFRDEIRKEYGTEIRKEVGESHANSDLYIKHKELSYLVHAQQSLWSQHAEELESFRHEQHSNLVKLAAAVGNKLDVVSELCRALHHNVKTILPEGRTSAIPETTWSSFQSEVDNASAVANSLQKDFDTACSRLNSNTTSAWPILQRKLVELSDSVNDVTRQNIHPQVVVDATQDSSHPNRTLDPLLTDPLKVHMLEGSKARACLQHQPNTVKSASSWKNLKEDLRSAADVLNDVCAESSPLQASNPCTSQARTFDAAHVDESQDDWWRELQEKHPDLARLVNSQRAELTRIVGASSEKQFQVSKQSLSPNNLASVLSPGDNFLLHRS